MKKVVRSAHPGLLGWCLGLWLPLVWCLCGNSPNALAEEIVGSCDPVQLQAALSAGGYVQLDCNGTLTLSSPLIISKDVILEARGGGVVLDGSKSVRLLQVETNVHFTLVGLRLTHGRGESGGALFATDARVELRNCVFEANEAVGSESPFRSAVGGAIYCRGGELLVASCEFIANTARATGGAGGAIAISSCTAQIQNSGFLENQASNGSASGGALADLGAGIFELQSCFFEGNVAVGGDGFRNGPGGRASGGAISSATDFNAQNCTFVSNLTQGGGGQTFYGGDGAGGALSLGGKSILVGCQFSLNQASAGRGVANQVGGGLS